MWSFEGHYVVKSSCQELFCWIVVFKGGFSRWWYVVVVTRIGDGPISCCTVVERETVVFCDVVCSCKGVPMEEIPLVYSVDAIEFDWLFCTVVTGGVVSLLWEDLSCPCSVLFKVCVLLDDLR